MVKGRDMIYKLYIVPILTCKLSPIALFMLPTKDNIRALLLQSAIPVDNL